MKRRPRHSSPVRRPPGPPQAILDEARHNLLLAVKLGLELTEAARYAGVDPADIDPALAREIESARTELAVYAAGVVRRAMADDPALAKRILDEQAAVRELEDLKAVAEGTA